MSTNSRPVKVSGWAHWTRSMRISSNQKRPQFVASVPRSIISPVMSSRPGTGIPAWRLEEIYGRRASRDIAQGALLSGEDIEGGLA